MFSIKRRYLCEGLQRKARNPGSHQAIRGRTCSGKPGPGSREAIRGHTLFALLICLFCLPVALQAQSILSSTVTLDARKQPLRDVLTILGNEAHVTFSYPSSLLPADSLVTLKAQNQPLREVLRQLLDARYEFKESGHYVIIRRRPVGVSAIQNKGASRSDLFTISGLVVDAETGDKIPDVSVYEEQQLVSVLTDEQGRFSLKLKSRYPNARLAISRRGYLDTLLILPSKYHQQVLCGLQRDKPEEPPLSQEIPWVIEPVPPVLSDSVTDTYQQGNLESKWLARWLLSTRQRIQSLNLKRFYTTRLWQISIVPGVSTHGAMNAQVISHTSINVLGGYSGGVQGLELGGIFNMNRRQMEGVQMAGVMNITGGDVQGLQASGLLNDVAGSLKGVQMAGVVNRVSKKFRGMQTAGLISLAGDSTKGAQMSGLINVSRGLLRGIQISSLVNYARKLKGLQIGLINVTDSCRGTSIGLINVSKYKNRRRVGFILRVPRKEKYS